MSHMGIAMYNMHMGMYLLEAEGGHGAEELVAVDHAGAVLVPVAEEVEHAHLPQSRGNQEVIKRQSGQSRVPVAEEVEHAHVVAGEHLRGHVRTSASTSMSASMQRHEQRARACRGTSKEHEHAEARARACRGTSMSMQRHERAAAPRRAPPRAAGGSDRPVTPFINIH